MKTFGVVVLVGFLCLVGMGGCGVICVVNTLNTEATMKNGIKAQEDVREAAFDKLWKKISQATQITKASSELQVKLVHELVAGRPGGFVRVVNEQNPASAFDRQQFDKLSNMVEGERDSFFREQKYLISKVEAYNNVFDTVVSGFILKFAGREKYPAPLIISSDKTKGVRESGVDNDTNLGL